MCAVCRLLPGHSRNDDVLMLVHYRLANYFSSCSHSHFRDYPVVPRGPDDGFVRGRHAAPLCVLCCSFHACLHPAGCARDIETWVCNRLIKKNAYGHWEINLDNKVFQDTIPLARLAVSMYTCCPISTIPGYARSAACTHTYYGIRPKTVVLSTYM